MKMHEQLAFRAKQMAITKMKAKDYEGAWSMLQQVKNFYPELEYLPQMLAVCNILWAAKPTLPAYGINWHSLLNISPSSNETFIRIQFQELVLCIEPMKKKFPGTELVLEVLNDAMIQLSDQVTKSKTIGPESSCVSPPVGVTGAVEEKKVFSCHAPGTNEEINKDEGKSSKSKKKRNSNSDVFYERRITRSATEKKRLATSPQSDTNLRLPLQIRGSEQVGFGLGICQTTKGINSKISEDDEGLKIDYLKNARDPPGGGNCDLPLDALPTQVKNNRNGEPDGAVVSKVDHCFSPEFRALKASLFAAMPQNPHYHALKEYSSEVREAMIVGVEFSFVCLCEGIREMALQNFKFRVGSFHQQLSVFEKMGYDVQKLRKRLYTLGVLVDRGQALLDTIKKLETDVKDTEIEIRASEDKLSALSSHIVKLQSEIKTLKQEMQAPEILLTSQKSQIENLRSNVRQIIEDSANIMTKFASVASSPW
ncbi:DUF724 domain-containing protein 1-like [Aristolochia californica]|uniref:DUF724 domain-containing protein 1-like n=1 Tax=Aristolochia californica TaxID=171875 RepID=UPI0035D84702